MKEVPVPKHVPSKEEDFWSDTLWSNTDYKLNNPTLIAARWLAKKGFGITFEPAFDASGTPLDTTHVAIHVATFEDRKALNAVADSPEIRDLQRSVYAGLHIADPVSWYQKAERVIEQVIKQKKLKPKLMARLKRVLTRR